MTNKPTILIVDDEPTVRGLLRTILETAHGFSVLDAPQGAPALETYRRNRDVVSLAIIDMIAPGTQLPQIAKSLKEITPGLPLIFMSGFGEKQGPNRHAFLKKPFSADQLLAAVTACSA